MKGKYLILSTGLAMFSMFFGSGNLVFPLVVGQTSGGSFGFASVGILLTGVLVPFLGILAIFLFDGNSNEFFKRLGRPAVFWFPLIALSLMGPFGVLARCITVAHGAFRLLVPEISLSLFSIIYCGAIFILTIRKNRIVPLLGSILTPVLLVSLGVIAVLGAISGEIPASRLEGSWAGFKNGVFQGYQTMDLLAAFFFSSFVIKYLKDRLSEENQKHSLPIFFKASLVGAGLLSLVYFALVFLGAMFAPQLKDIPPQEMLGFVAQASLGDWAAPIVCVTVVLACMTTAVVLASLFADFLRKEVAKEKITNGMALALTLCIAFSTSTLEFSGIARFLGPVLETIYPALIVLTVLSIFHKWWGWSTVRMPIAIAFLAKIILRAI